MWKQCSCILCGNHVCNVFALSVDESQESYDKQNYQFGKYHNGTSEQLKDKIQEKDVVMGSIKWNGKIFGSFLGHGIFGF